MSDDPPAQPPPVRRGSPIPVQRPQAPRPSPLHIPDQSPPRRLPLPKGVPAAFKCHGFCFRIYATADGRFVFRFKHGSKWRTQSRRDLSKLKLDAERIALALRNGETAALDITAEERRIFVSAREATGRFGRAVDSVCREWAEAQAILGERVSLLGVVREWSRRHLEEHCEYYQYRLPPSPFLEVGKSAEGIPLISGIYFVWNGGKVVYVGRSGNLSRRCFLGAKHEHLIPGDWISWLEEPESRLKIAEAFYIGSLKPERNFSAKHPAN